MRAVQTLTSMTRTSQRRAAMRGLSVLVLVGSAAGLGLVPAAAAAGRPSKPTSLTAVAAGSSGHYLRWSSPTVTRFVIEQASVPATPSGAHKYSIRGYTHQFTPYGLSPGTTYSFRVRAVNNGSTSAASNAVSFLAGAASSDVRVVAYNSLSASFDQGSAAHHPGGNAEPFVTKRGPKQITLLNGAHPDVIGIEEAASIIHKIQGKNAYRQIDWLADHLGANYTLDDTYNTNGSVNRYTSNYILYGPAVAPVRSGGTWVITPSGSSVNPGYAAYQAFRVVSTGAQFLFVDTHLASARNASTDRARGTETQNMLRQAKAYASRLGISSIIYVGDFNSYWGAWQVNDITGRDMQAAGVPDGIAVAQHYVRAKYDSINSLYRTARHGHGSADHIYATGGIGVKTWGELMDISHGQFVGTIPSDHNPVYADLTIPN